MRKAKPGSGSSELRCGEENDRDGKVGGPHGLCVPDVRRTHRLFIVYDRLDSFAANWNRTVVAGQVSSFPLSTPLSTL